MTTVKIEDDEGSAMVYCKFKALYYPTFANLGETLENLADWTARDDDVIVLSYPKSGTHWISEVAQMLISGTAELTEHGKTEYMMELVGLPGLDEISSPRLLNTHLRPEFYPKDMAKRKCKIIYLTRNPKDVFVSFYHHSKNVLMYKYSGTWNGFFKLAISGNVDYGSWFEYTLDWDRWFTQHTDVPVLRLTYEDLKEDLSSGVSDVAKFLGTPCDDKLLSEICTKCTFDHMKSKRESEKTTRNAIWYKDGKTPMFRKGKIGDWKNWFTVAQSDLFDAEYERQMGTLSIGKSFQRCL